MRSVFRLLLILVLFFLVTPDINAIATLTKNIRAGNADGVDYQSDVVNVNGTVYFAGNNGSVGFELWKSDGTSIGTTMVKDIYSGATGSYPKNLVNVNGSLFFTAATGVGVSSLCVSNGTEAGTVVVKNISITNATKDTSANTANGKLIFWGYDAANGRELWSSDGTSIGTTLIHSFGTGTSGITTSNEDLDKGVTIGNFLYFGVNPGPSTRWQLWKTDGSDAGTEMVYDFGNNGIIYEITLIDSSLYIRANYTGVGIEPFISDGTTAGTHLIKDVRAGTSSSYSRGFVKLGSTIYFTAETPTVQIWQTDGTEGGTSLLFNDPSPTGSTLTPIVIGDYFYYPSQKQLWRSNGTLVGTTLVKDIDPLGDASVWIEPWVKVGNTLYFSADDGVAGIELWSSDGTPDGTVVQDIAADPLHDSWPDPLVEANGALFVVADHNTYGTELWTVAGPPPPNQAPTAPTTLWTEGLVDPVGIIDTTPEISAIYNDPDVGDIANKYQIQVDDNSDFTSVVWETDASGTTMADCTASTRCADISYAGTALSFGTTYYWRIKYWDDENTEGVWSAGTDTFSLGQPPTAPTNLFVEGSSNPSGILDTTPEFSAIYNDPDVGDIANKYQIQVDDNSDFGSTKWSTSASGTALANCTAGNRCADISYAGGELTRGITYYWRIKYWDDSPSEGIWSTGTNTFSINQLPATPFNTSPLDNASNQSLNPTLTSNSFSDQDSEDTHANSQWQISLVPNFQTVVWDSSTTATNLTTIVVNSSNGTFLDTLLGQTSLNYSTQYYYRVRTQDNNSNWSSYSVGTLFTTTTAPAPTSTPTPTPLPTGVLSVVHTSQADFQAGDVGTSFDASGIPGSLQLKRNNFFTHTTASDFSSGTYNTVGYLNLEYVSDITSNSGGEITIAKDKVIDQEKTNLSFEVAQGPHIYFERRNYDTTKIYVTDYKNTFDTTDDERLGYYDQNTTPAVNTTNINDFVYDNSRDLLYVNPYGEGITVIDTHGTTTISDDTIAGYYNNSSFPQINNAARLRFHYYDSTSGFLFFSYGTGSLYSVIKIDTNHTNIVSDDSVVWVHDSTEIPALNYASVLYYHHPSQTLYLGNDIISTLSVYDTSSSLTLLGFYGTGGDALLNSVALSYKFAQKDGKIYLVPYSVWNGHIYVIDTHNTQTLADNTLDDLYYPDLVNTIYTAPIINPDTNKLFVNHSYSDTGNYGFSIIDLDTQEIVDGYHAHDYPELLSLNPIKAVFVPDPNWFFFQGGSSVFSININPSYEAPYYPRSMYQSEVITFGQSPFNFSWGQDLHGLPANSVLASYRLGVGTTFNSNFSNNDTTMFRPFTGWGGGTFGSITTDNNYVQFRTPSTWDTYTVYDTGLASDAFGIESSLTVRARVSGPSDMGVCIFYDPWNGNGTCQHSLTAGQWYDISYIKENVNDNSDIGLNLFTESRDPFNAADYLEVDSISVNGRSFDDWADLGSINTGMTLPDSSGKNNFQYRLNLFSSSDLMVAPEITDVSLGTFETSAQYLSSIIDVGVPSDWQELTVDGAIPEGSTLIYFTRTGNTSTPDGTWSDWTIVNSPIASPDDTRYLQYRIDAVSAPDRSPVIDSVTVSYVPNTIPTPTPTDDPTPTPPTPTEAPTSTPTTTPTPTLTPTLVPTATSSPDNGAVLGDSDTSDSTDNIVPPNAPYIFQIDTTSTSATLHFSPVSGPNSYYFISYGTDQNATQYAVKFNQGQSPGALTYTIGFLEPNTKYYFKIHGGNANTSSPWSTTVSAKTSKNGSAQYPIPTDILPFLSPSPTPFSVTSLINNNSSGSSAGGQTSGYPQTFNNLPLTYYVSDPKPKIPKTDGTVFALISTPTDYYFAGDFTQIDNKPGSIAKIDNNGTVQCLLPVTGTVYSLAYDKTTDLLYIGGQFTAINGVSVNNLAVINGKDCSVKDTGVPIVESIASLAVNTDTQQLYLLTKPKTTVIPRPTNTLKPTKTIRPTSTKRPTSTLRPTSTRRPTATLRPTNTPRPTNTTRPTATRRPTSTLRPTSTRRPTNTPRGMSSPTPTLSYTPTPTSTNTPTNTPTATNTPTFTPTPTNTPTSTPTFTLTPTYTPTITPTSTLTLTPIPSSDSAETTSVSPTDSPVPTPTPTGTASDGTVTVVDLETKEINEIDLTDGIINTIAITEDNKSLVIAGSFTQVQDSPRSNIASVDTASMKTTSWNPQLQGTVKAIAIKNSVVYASGDFATTSEQKNPHFVALSLDTGDYLPWDPECPWWLRLIFIQIVFTFIIRIVFINKISQKFGWILAGVLGGISYYVDTVAHTFYIPSNICYYLWLISISLVVFNLIVSLFQYIYRRKKYSNIT